MVCLKNHRELLLDLTDKLDLPAEAVVGAVKLTVTAGQKALIENHRGILEFGPERIVVRTESGRLVITGASLGIRGMDRQDLLIIGNLQYAEWE